MFEEVIPYFNSMIKMQKDQNEKLIAQLRRIADALEKITETYIEPK